METKAQNLESIKPTLYLYSRVSTEKQVSGTGIQRQTSNDRLPLVIDKFQLPVKRLEDHGLSAHKGHNIDRGELGVFIDLCERGKIAPGSILAMEAIDRFTRLGITTAQSHLNKVLNADIKIFCWIKGELYEKDDLGSAFKALIELEGANAYTKKLSQRVTGAARVKLTEIMENRPGSRDADGYCAAIKGFGSNKWWCTVDSGFVRPHPQYWSIAREIVDLLLQGWGHIKIKKYLDGKEYPPPRRQKNKNAKGWGINLVSNFHRSRTLLGEKEISIDGFSELIKNYYPPLCTEKEYLKILKIKQGKKLRGVKKGAIGLITGINATRCGYCDSPIQIFRSKATTPYERLRYKCSGKSTGSTQCPSSTIDSRYVESATIKLLSHLALQRTPKENDGTEDIIEAKLSGLDKKIERLIVAVETSESNTAAKVFAQKADKLSIEKEALTQDLQELREQQNVEIDPLAVNQIPTNILDYDKTEIRKPIQQKISSLVKKIWLFSQRDLLYLKFELKTGHSIGGYLLDKKYLLDDQLTWLTENPDPKFRGAYEKVQQWNGTDKSGNIIKIKNVDWSTLNSDDVRHFGQYITRAMRGPTALLKNPITKCSDP